VSLLNLLAQGNLKKFTNEIILEYAITPKKGFSQNFVVRKALIDEIISIAEITNDDSVIEVGGGIGTLTYFLLENAKEVFSYEIDPLLSSILKKEFYTFKDKLKVISADFLKEDIIPNNKIISNLPYSISSPFISKISNSEIPPSLVVVTVQEEFANHLCAKMGSSNYSRLSVYASYFFKFEKMKKFPPEYFYPKPKVSSFVVKGIPVQSPVIVKENGFFPFLTALFTRKHRKSRNNFTIFQKKLTKQDRSKFQKSMDIIDGSSKQPINLTPEEILKFYSDFRNMIKEEFTDTNFPELMEGMGKSMDTRQEKMERKP
jgi:16S rRNA (adenine1518-N6/adenine1519-N6)-dimethyltransferase